METKKTGVAVVTESKTQALLRRGPARDLAPDEERALRMRLGASPARTAPLERAAPAGSDLEIELQALEIEAYMKWKARAEAPAAAVRAPARARVTPAAVPSRTKEKILRALRKKV